MGIRDLTKQKFGKLIALEFKYTKKTHAYWSFKCTQCGNIVVRNSSNVISGNTKSCCRYKFSNDQVIEMRELKEAGHTLSYIGKHFNTAHSTVRECLKRPIYLCTGGTL